MKQSLGTFPMYRSLNRDRIVIQLTLDEKAEKRSVICEGFNDNLLLTDAEAARSRLEQEVPARPVHDESADLPKKHRVSTAAEVLVTGCLCKCPATSCSFARADSFFFPPECHRGSR